MYLCSTYNIQCKLCSIICPGCKFSAAWKEGPRWIWREHWQQREGVNERENRRSRSRLEKQSLLTFHYVATTPGRRHKAWDVNKINPFVISHDFHYKKTFKKSALLSQKNGMILSGVRMICGQEPRCCWTGFNFHFFQVKIILSLSLSWK